MGLTLIHIQMEGGVYPDPGVEVDLCRRTRVNSCSALLVAHMASEGWCRLISSSRPIYGILNIVNDSRRHTRQNMQRTGKVLRPILRMEDRSRQAPAALTYID